MTPKISTNMSPWLQQLQRTRPAQKLSAPARTDFCIVGGGIAGISTAYFLLKHTSKHVILLEAERVAHGATGHNAGQLVSYFEKPFHEIVNEFDLEMAAAGQQAVNSAWDLLDDIRADLDIETPRDIFTGYAGILDRPTLIDRLRSSELKKRAGIDYGKIYVAKEFARSLRIPRNLRGLYEFTPHKDILALLETKDKRYKAALVSKKGCMNSARFTEEVASKLLERYKDRFSLYEESPVETIELRQHQATLHAGKFNVTASRVILCTNGFERIHIVNTHGGSIETKFHHLVRGSVGYMAAFVEPEQGAPIAISYLPAHGKREDAYGAEPYVYMTRRRHTYGAAAKRHQSLICIGGPESLMDDTNGYSKEHPYPTEAESYIRRFLKKTYRNTGRAPKYQYLWHGLMGYTPNGLRCVGVEPCNPSLLYNLGCNGVGILPSVYGGLRIAQILRGDRLPASIFDPQDQRCMLPLAHEHKPASPWFLALFGTLAIILILLITLV